MANKQDIMESLIDLKMFDEDEAKKYLEYMKNLGQHIPFEDPASFIPSDEAMAILMTTGRAPEAVVRANEAAHKPDPQKEWLKSILSDEAAREYEGYAPSPKNQGRKQMAEGLMRDYPSFVLESMEKKNEQNKNQDKKSNRSFQDLPTDGVWAFPDPALKDIDKKFPLDVKQFYPNNKADRFYNPELEALAANPKADKALDAMAAEQKGLIQNQEKIKQELLAEQAKAEEKRKARHAKLARFFEDPMYQVAALDYIYKGDATGLNNILMRMANEDAQNASKEAAKSAKEEAKADENKRKEKADAEAKRKLAQETETAKEEYEQARRTYSRAANANPDSEEAKEALHNRNLKALIYKHKLEDSGMDMSEIDKVLSSDPPKDSQTTGSTFNDENASKGSEKKTRAVAVIEADIKTKMGLKDAKRKKAELRALYEELERTSPNKTEVRARWTELEAKLDKEIADQEKAAGYKAEASKAVGGYDDSTKRDAAYNKLSKEAQKLVKKKFVNGKYSLILKE